MDHLFSYPLRYFFVPFCFMSIFSVILFHSTVLGKKQALISLSDKKDLSLLGVGLQELG